MRFSKDRKQARRLVGLMQRGEPDERPEVWELPDSAQVVESEGVDRCPADGSGTDWGDERISGSCQATRVLSPRRPHEARRRDQRARRAHSSSLLWFSATNTVPVKRPGMTVIFRASASSPRRASSCRDSYYRERANQSAAAGLGQVRRASSAMSTSLGEPWKELLRPRRAYASTV